MIRFYFSPPQPRQGHLVLEEAGLEYDAVPVDTRKGEQHTPDFKALNPNAKVPVIVDGETVVFDSNAILLYLAEKTGQFMPADTAGARTDVFVADVRRQRYRSFQWPGSAFQALRAGHAPYSINRYDFEAWRHWLISSTNTSSNRPWMIGSDYSLVDMAVWGWARAVPFVLNAAAWNELPHVKRLLDEINARPRRSVAEALKDRFSFKAEMDDEANKAMFPQNARLPA